MKQDLSNDLKLIEMYGTVFNCLGYGLEALRGNIPNARVPTYLMELYNNESETTHRKRLKN